MSFMAGDEISGFSTEIVREIIQRTQTKAKVELVPWARAYKIASEQANVALFTTARTIKRESLFHWIAPIVGKRWQLFAKSKSNIELNSLDEAKIFDIGVRYGDARTIFLQEHGFENLYKVSLNSHSLNMLMKDRVQLWASSDFEAPVIIGKTRHQYTDVKVAFTLKKIESYLVLSKGTSPAVVKRWQKAYLDMTRDGSITRIADKWAQRLDLPLTGEKGVITFRDY